MNIPQDLKYTKEHEWARIEGKVATIGITDYAQSEIKIRIIMENLVDKVVEKDGVKVNLKQGKVTMIFGAYLVTDFENRWSGKPVFFLLKSLTDKYIHGEYTAKWKDEIINDCDHIQTLVKSFLNLYRY